jgi:hypothetical protein
MRHLLPFLGGFLAGIIASVAFPGSVSSNQMLYGLLAGGGVFLFLGVMVWVIPMIPPLTPEQIEYQRWADSWTPPRPSYQNTYQEDPYVVHQRHLQDQARMGWLMGDRDYPPTDWYGR